MVSCSTFHYDIFRTGRIDGFQFPPGATLEPWGRYLSLPIGAVRAAPLFAEMPGDPDRGEPATTVKVFVATTGNRIFAYSEDSLLTGLVQPDWMTDLSHLMPPSQRNDSNLTKPIGICGTPVLSTSPPYRLFVLLLTEESNKLVYYICALDPYGGALVDRAKLRDSGGPHRSSFDTDEVDQRGALNLVRDYGDNPGSGGSDGHLYATFAAFKARDEGPYHGWVVRIDRYNLEEQQYLPMAEHYQGCGVWGPAGVSASPDGSVYLSTGNGPKDVLDDSYWDDLESENRRPPDDHDYPIAVVRVKAEGTPPKLNVIGWYMPSDAQDMNENDLDLGGSSVLVLPGLGRKLLLVTTSKKGDMFLLSELNGRNWGNELDRVQVFDGIYGVPQEMGKGKGIPAAFLAPDGRQFVYVSGAGTPGLVAYTIDKDIHGQPKFKLAWKATADFSGTPYGKWPGSPIVTASPDGTTAWVWVVDDANFRDKSDQNDNPVDGLDYEPRLSKPVLHAYDALSGIEKYASTWTLADAIDPHPDYGTSLHFPPMTCTQRSVFVGTRDGLACYGPLAAWKTKPTINLAVLHIDSPAGPNSAFYRIGFDLDQKGAASQGWTWAERNRQPGQDFQVDGWFGNGTQGAGIAIADVDQNGRRDLIVFHIDQEGDHDKGFYRIIRNLGAGGATGGAIPPDHGKPIKVHGWFGSSVQGGGIAATDLMGTGNTDLVVFHINDFSGNRDKDKGFYRIGRQLSPQTGEASIWIPQPNQEPLSVPGMYGKDVQTSAITVASIRAADKHDLIVFHVDAGSGRDQRYQIPGGPADWNKGFYRIGWNIDPQTGVARDGWTDPILVPGWYGLNTQGAGIAAVDLDGDGWLELIVFHIDHGTDSDGNSLGNIGFYRVGLRLDPNDGQIKGGWSWHAAPDPLTSPYVVPGWFGDRSAHAGIAIGNFRP